MTHIQQAYINDFLKCSACALSADPHFLIRDVICLSLDVWNTLFRSFSLFQVKIQVSGRTLVTIQK